jgi:hypothetical protein
MYKRNAAGTYTQLGSNFTVSAMNTTGVFSLDINIVYGVSGSVTIYFAGTSVFSFSGDTTTDSATTLNSVEFAGMAAGSSNVVWSEVIIADSDTRSMGLWLLNSSTSGTDTQWTGTASNVNKAAISDSTFISSGTAAQINEYKTGGIAVPTGVYLVPAVTQSMRALAAATGPQHVDMGFNFNGSRFWSSDFAPGLSFGNFSNLVWPTNPSTSAPWTVSDLTAATFNYGVQSTT